VAEDAELLAFVELIFFAYRDFTGEADAALAELGFGRAHHRVLHFVNRRPGLRVADLLDILKITKQSAARVLKELIEKGYIEQQPGQEDRRERLLFATATGARLASELSSLQIARIGRALADAGPDAVAAVRRFLVGMVSEDERRRIEGLVLEGEVRQARRGRT
jgi:DNA-binding MarR family transcriptional regulator